MSGCKCLACEVKDSYNKMDTTGHERKRCRCSKTDAVYTITLATPADAEGNVLSFSVKTDVYEFYNLYAQYFGDTLDLMPGDIAD